MEFRVFDKTLKKYDEENDFRINKNAELYKNNIFCNCDRYIIEYYPDIKKVKDNNGKSICEGDECILEGNKKCYVMRDYGMFLFNYNKCAIYLWNVDTEKEVEIIGTRNQSNIV